MLPLFAKHLEAQPAYCQIDGVPAGYGVICVNPWSPEAGADFELNFSSNSCYTNSPHDYQIFRDGNDFNIYLVYRIGGCPGVPQSPATFTTVQDGVPVGEYRANLYRLTVFNWPPPAFNPADYELRNTVPFTVQGEPTIAQPVPALSSTTLVLFSFLLLLVGNVAFRLRRT
jgi:hypothetical protein